MPRPHSQRFWFNSSGVRHWYFESSPGDSNAQSGLRDAIKIGKHGSGITLFIAIITGRISPLHTHAFLTCPQLREELGAAGPHHLRVSSVSHITRNISQVSRGDLWEAPQATIKRYMTSRPLFLFWARLREYNLKEEWVGEELSIEAYSGPQKNVK